MPRRGLAADGCHPGQQRDVLDGVLDVEVLQGGDVEVGRVEVGLDQARHDGAAPGVEVAGLGAGGGAPRAGPA
jgi:hypothetical protein